MSGIIKRIPNMSLEGINTLRKNAKERFDNPKYTAYAQEILVTVQPPRVFPSTYGSV